MLKETILMLCPESSGVGDLPSSPPQQATSAFRAFFHPISTPLSIA
jgi:hypothetical protein